MSLPPTVTTVLEPGDLMNGYYAARERVMERFEREFLDAVLKRFDGDFMRAAAKAKVHNSWLRKIAKKYR